MCHKSLTSCFNLQGFGEAVRFQDFTEDQLEAAIHKVIGDPSYKEAISAASAIYRSQPMTALQRAVWWIEHVMKHGGRHYRTHALDMPWYQYLMLDILVFLMVVLFSVVVLLRFCVSFLFVRKSTTKVKTN